MSEVKVTDKSTPPPGVLPRRLQGILISVIAGLILMSSYCSSWKSQRSPVAQATNNQIVHPPNSKAIKDLEKELNKERLKLEETKRAVAAATQARQSSPAPARNE